MYTLNCKGKLLTFNKPIVMGIINATPDSFYRGNLHDDILALASKMINEGATMLDIGGQSTRPGSERITAEEELERVLPVIKKIHQQFPETVISIDTYYSSVAEAAVLNGASIVNDVSAGNMDAAMLSTVAALKVPYICMHMQGTPDTMQQSTRYENLVDDVLNFFIRKIEECKTAGINDVIIDPGFGFGKTIEQNLALLKSMHVLSVFDKPILAGLSRKSTIYKTLGITADEALNGTTALNTIALLNGAAILRVHDVKEAIEVTTLFDAYQQA
ncbi:dihydropteroate synthase [Ferruginibacter lapsinanis]|nr:dihydropteroate synthase [Ferruginibacter lapsinanis]